VLGGGKVAQIMYTRVSELKNGKIKIKKCILPKFFCGTIPDL
jgi:hypothetical protein